MRQLSTVRETAERKLREKGVGKFAYTITSSRMEEFNAAGNEFSLLRTVFSSSFSLSVFIDGRKGTAAGTDFSDEAIEKTVDEAVKAAEASERDEAYDIAPSIGTIENDRGHEGSTELFFERLKKLMDTIVSDYPSILVMQAIGQNTSYETIYANSNGTEYLSKGGFYEVYFGFSAHEGDRTTGICSTEFMTKSLDRPFIEMASVRRDLENAVKSLETTSFEGKFDGTVIFTPDCLSQFLYFFAEEISDGPIMQGVSPLKDRLGEKIADERITISLLSSSPDIVNGEVITDDGFRTEDTPIIENGVLKNFVLSLYAANKTGKTVTKNSSMDVVMEKGDRTLEEIIASVSRGLIVGGFSGGQPSVSGDFSGVAKNSFYIEDGRIRGAVNETMINGNLLEMLKNVSAVSSERISNGSTVLPYLAVNHLVISSK